MLKISKTKLGSVYPEVYSDINSLIECGATGGEIISSIGKYLIDLKAKNENVYLIISHEVDDYLESCFLNGFEFETQRNL